MSAYDELPEAQKKAYHVVNCLQRLGGGPAFREVYNHCSTGHESTSHSFYDQLNLPKDAFLKPPPKLGNTGRREKEPLQRKGELDKWEATLKQRETEQIARQKKLQEAEDACNLRETQLNDWEARLADRETRFGTSKKSVHVRFDVSDSPSDDAADGASTRPTGREGPASREPGKEMVWCDKCELLFDPKRNHAGACQYHPGKLDTINPEDCQRLTGKPAEAFDGRKGLEFLLASYPGCLEFGCCFSKSRVGCKVGPHQHPILW